MISPNQFLKLLNLIDSWLYYLRNGRNFAGLSGFDLDSTLGMGDPRMTQSRWLSEKDSQDSEKAAVLMVYHSKRLKLKSSKDRCFGDKICATGHRLPDVLSVESHMCLILPATKCDNTCKVLSTREPPISVGVQVSYWGVTQACSTFVTGLSYSDASLPEQKEVFTANHLS